MRVQQQRVVGEQVPDRLARSLAYQREWFCRQSLRGAEVRFVPIDFTSDADGLQPVDYGADALWEALEAALPLGLRGMIEQFREGRRVLEPVDLTGIFQFAREVEAVPESAPSKKPVARRPGAARKPVRKAPARR